MLKKNFFNTFQSGFVGLEYISKKITKEILKSIYIYLWEKILENSISSNEYFID
jgi:hypothetical protein